MKVNKIAILSLFTLSLVAYISPSLAVGEASKTPSSAALSFDQIKMAAQSGDADAQYALGYMYYYGKSGAPKDSAEAKKWIAKAAGQRQAQAMKALDLMNKQTSPVASEQSPPTNVNVQQSYPATTPQQKTDSSAANEAASTIKTAAETASLNNKESELRERLAQENKMTLVDMRNQKPSTAKTAEPINEEQETSDINKEMTKEKPVAPNIKESGNFTLQLLGSYHKDLVAKEMTAKHLNGKANIYQTKFNNKDWYVLTYGRYETKSQARDIAKSLEQRLDVKPWVKPVSTMQTYKKLK